MDTFPGEHDETSKLGIASVSFTVGVLLGCVVTLYMTWDERRQIGMLRESLEVSREETHAEQMERKVFSDGLAGCFDRLGKEARK